MKITKNQLNKIKKFVIKKISKNDDAHGIDHIEKTVKFAKYLAKKEKADICKCEIAAWLHDIAKKLEKKGKDHGNVGAKEAKIFLKTLKLQKEDIKDIVYIIQRHNKGGKKKIIEAKIIWDADKLQLLGPKGLLRSYRYLISKGKDQKTAYKIYRKQYNFYIKKFHTKTAKKIVKKDREFFKKFNIELQKKKI